MEQVGTRTAGWALVGSAAASLLVMGHHPTSAHAGVLNVAVHGILIALAAVAAYGFLHWSRLRGLDRPAVAAALIAYLLAMFGGIGAATINGFVITALVHGHGQGAGGADVHRLAWEANQALAQLGVVAAGAAYMLWSLDLLRAGASRAEKAVGLAGLLLGGVPVALLAAGMIGMDLRGGLIVYGAQWAWMALVGLLMLAMSRLAPVQ